MAKYLFKYGNIYSGREKSSSMNVQKNLQHWNYSKKSDERDGYKVNISSFPNRKYRSQSVSEYKAVNKKTGDYYIATLDNYKKQ